MKKTLLFLILLAITVSECPAFKVLNAQTGVISDKEVIAPPERTVEKLSNGTKVTYTITIHQYSNIPYPPQRSFFKEPIVSNISFNSFNEVEIELDGDTDGSTLTISEADNLLSARPFSYSVTETTVTHQIQNSGCHFFIISLSKNGEILYSKTIFKK